MPRTSNRRRNLAPPPQPPAPAAIANVEVTQNENFMMEKVPDWKYRGFPVKINLRNEEELLIIRNSLWTELRYVLRDMFSVRVEPNTDYNGFVIKILECIARKKTTMSMSDKVMALVEVTLSPCFTYFVVRILDRDLADSRMISVENLHIALGKVFETALARCGYADGDFGELEAEDLRRMAAIAEEPFWN